MTPKIPANPAVTALVHQAWEHIVRVCNTTLTHADIYGFQLMSLPEPDVASLYRSLTFTAMPVLERLITDFEFDHDEERKLINMKHYLLLLKTLVLAIEADNEEEFTQAIAVLNRQSFL